MAKDKKKKGAEPTPEELEAMQTSGAPRLRTQYETEVREKLGEEFGVTNPNAMPRLEKISINVNMGRHLDGTKVPGTVRETVLKTLETISGQKPVMVNAKKSVSNFKVREGYETAAMVTIRRDRMWHFLDRLIHLAMPRVKDFRGVKDTAFDRQGNYSLGFNEQGIFPEINMAEVNFTHGMNINLSFSNSDPKMSRFVLDQLGMPFVKKEERKK